jgi:peptidoglycan/LPS O-acetylase OafA/YrhL
MKKEFSLYLDLVRFVASAMVVIFHSNIRALITEKLPLTSHFHAAVIVFFVLSGYVISYITDTKEGLAIDYWSSRLSRFYSLVIPVVLLCPVLDAVGGVLGPQFYGGHSMVDYAWLRILSSLTFMNEIWGISITSFSNTPFWSLCYEMWYYILFAIVTFTTGKPRIVLASLAAALIGPKILLLAPVWILGVVLYRWQALYKIPEWSGWALFLVSWPLYFMFIRYQMTDYGSDLLRMLIGSESVKNMTWSKSFITDYLLGLIIAANFVGFRRIAYHFSTPLAVLERPIRWLAAFTFSLYVFHQPLLQFYAALINGNPDGPLFYFEVMAATIFTIIVVVSYFERQRYPLRRWLRTQLTNLTASATWRKQVSSRLTPSVSGT